MTVVQVPAVDPLPADLADVIAQLQVSIETMSSCLYSRRLKVEYGELSISGKAEAILPTMTVRHLGHPNRQTHCWCRVSGQNARWSRISTPFGC